MAIIMAIVIIVVTVTTAIADMKEAIKIVVMMVGIIVVNLFY